MHFQQDWRGHDIVSTTFIGELINYIEKVETNEVDLQVLQGVCVLDLRGNNEDDGNT